MNSTSSSSSCDAFAAGPSGRFAVRGELEPRERVDGDGIGRDPANVAEELEHARARQNAADAIAEPGQVFTRDRSVHGERTECGLVGHRG